jgi:hypothetical protein
MLGGKSAGTAGLKGDLMLRTSIIVVILLLASCTASNQEAECTRAVLQSAVDDYVAAQEAGDPSKMHFATTVKYIQDMEEISKEEGIWNTPLPIAFHRSFLDVKTCMTFTEVIVTEGDHPYVLGTRLKVEDGEISEIHSLVTDKDDWLFNADNYLKYSTAEDWRVLNPEERVSREELIAAGNAYFDHFSDQSVDIPFNTPCARLEGGLYTTPDFDDPNASCDIGFPENGTLPMTGRSYVVDEDMGTVNIFLHFGNPPGAPDSHTFRLVNGKIRYVHTLTLTVPGTPTEQIMGGSPEAKPEIQGQGGQD